MRALTQEATCNLSLHVASWVNSLGVAKGWFILLHGSAALPGGEG